MFFSRCGIGYSSCLGVKGEGLLVVGWDIRKRFWKEVIRWYIVYVRSRKICFGFILGFGFIVCDIGELIS